MSFIDKIKSLGFSVKLFFALVFILLVVVIWKNIVEIRKYNLEISNFKTTIPNATSNAA